MGSEGEMKAVEYIKNEFNKLNINLREEPFEATTIFFNFLQGAMVIGILMMVILLVLSLISPILNLVFILITIIIVIILYKMTTKNSIKLPGKAYITRNLVQEIPPSREMKGNLIIMAHHDSKSQPLTTVQRTICFTCGLGGLILFIIGVLIKSFFVLFHYSAIGILDIFDLILAIIVILFLLPLCFNYATNKSPGALDNASGVAAVWALAKYVRDHPLNHLRLICIITGAEEYAMLGALAYYKDHGSELDPKTTFILNYDMLGHKDADAEILQYVGFPFRKATNKSLTPLAFQYAKELHIPFRGFWLPIGAGTDNFAFIKNGFEGIDFINLKASLSTHSPRDVPELYDSLKAAQDLAISMEIGNFLDEKVSEK